MKVPMPDDSSPKLKSVPTSTVGRGKAVTRNEPIVCQHRVVGGVDASLGNSLDHYERWLEPTTIISDGAYGVLGFEGDTSDHTGIPEWYEPHVKAWAEKATAQTTLWFWNSEIGWAAAHPILEKYGFRYVNANIWNKGVGHIAGNVNTSKIRRFPVTTEVCVQYVFEAKVGDKALREWLISEWKRSGLPMKRANTACGVADAATRKYLDAGHLWYFPPPEMFQRLSDYANEHGKPDGRPYFDLGTGKPGTADEWSKMRAIFNCPYGVTNVWERPALRGAERIKVAGKGAVHLNQKPLDLMQRLVEASTNPGDVIWEPFGGLFSASIAANRLGRRAFVAEIDETYFHYAIERLNQEGL